LNYFSTSEDGGQIIIDYERIQKAAPYEEFSACERIYYFTPGEFLYRKEPGTEAAKEFFCGYLIDEVWHYRIITAQETLLSAA
ncbi:MAG: hypothetical protein JOZ19_14320, partial [Rubrobacter sp.]|nr:hypothetical protein [Rubrobacter sp.]